MTPQVWRNETIGKSFDSDNYPKQNPYQCWDYFDAFVRYFKLGISTYCALTGYVCDLWRLKEKYGYDKVFEFITNAADLRVGDWVIWDRGSSHSYSHICMVYIDRNGNPVELGQNQGSPFVTEKVTSWDILGAFRFKGWDTLQTGAADLTMNEHSYSLYHQHPDQKTIVISAGLNKTQPIRNLDVNAPVFAKICGANFFQAKEQMDDPIGTTYGDISSPMSDVWRQLPNQDTTLYFDIENGMYGDCTGIKVNPTHNVYSPAVVFPPMGNYQYARMVGIGHVNTLSRYTFSIRLTDGTYAIGLANQDMTPKEIAFDFKTMLGAKLSSIAFLDGGGSAQMGRWNGQKFEYLRDTGRACPSAVAIIGAESASQTHENEPTQDEEQKDEEQTMIDDTIENQPIFEPIKDEDWTDPEPTADTTGEIILKRFLSVKSFVTLTLTGVFSYLSLTGKITQEQFMSVFTMCISFFFGYSFEKKTNQK